MKIQSVTFENAFLIAIAWFFFPQLSIVWLILMGIVAIKIERE